MVEFTCVGLDVHARSVTGCGINRKTGEIFEKKMSHDPGIVIDWLEGLPQPVRVVYEAGPTGYGLARVLTTAGIDCLIAAPSKLLPAPGGRVKTDRRDARHLAELVAANLITQVCIPTPAQESARDLVRARDGARGDLMRARHRLGKLLLRHNMICEHKAWSGEHTKWLSKLQFDDPVLEQVFDNNWMVVHQAQTRRDMLDKQIAELIPRSEWEPIVTALGCLRGVSALTGFGLAVEIGDWSRFDGSSIGSFVGLVPSERSSGVSRRLGGVTKTGNKYVRRLLVEAAWHHRSAYRPAVSVELNKRWVKATPAMVARGDYANRRLHAQWVNLSGKGKKKPLVSAAVAREMAGFCWSLAMMAT